MKAGNGMLRVVASMRGDNANPTQTLKCPCRHSSQSVIRFVFVRHGLCCLVVSLVLILLC